MADRRSRSRDALQEDQRPQRRDVFVIVDLMHLMNYSADDVDRFQSLRCLRAALHSDETVAAFSYFELIPFRSLGDFLVDDLAEKVRPVIIFLDLTPCKTLGEIPNEPRYSALQSVIHPGISLGEDELSAIFTDSKFIAASRLDDTYIFEILFGVTDFFLNVFGITLPAAGLCLKLDHGPGFPINREQMNWSMLKLLDEHLSGVSVVQLERALENGMLEDGRRLEKVENKATIDQRNAIQKIMSLVRYKETDYAPLHNGQDTW
eukprot:s612_g2.t1